MNAIPQGWRSVALGEVCEFRYGRSLPEAARVAGCVPVFGSNGQIGKHDEALTTGPAIVVGRKGSFGEVTYSPVGCWPIDTTYYVDITATSADLRWLTYRLAALGLNKLNRAAAVPGLNREDAYRQRLLLPPVAEQRRIADVLDKADALRAKRRSAIAKLDILTQSIFRDMFGGAVDNERGWPIARVSELCELVRGSSPRPQGDPRFFGGPVPRLMVADITRDGWLVTPRIDSLTIEGARRSRPVRAGTVVMAVSGNVGLVSRLAIDACVHDGFVAFTELDEHRCHSVFLLALLHFSKSLHEKSKAGAIFVNLTTTDIKAMRLPIPPYELQSKFSARVSEVDKLRDAKRESLQKLNTLFDTLQQRASRGKLFS